jgi:hypothetical protein
MSSFQEAPALIQYACERCKTRFVLPPSRRKLSIAGKLRALSMGVSRALKFHEGLGASCDTSSRQLLAKMDDEAYQSFVQSFRFCHECRQFVCNECWSSSRRSCLTCVAKSMAGAARPRPPFAPTGPEIPRPVVSSLNPPRKGRMRRNVLLVGLALMIVIVSLDAGILLVGAMPGAAANANASASAPTATPAPTASPTGEPSETDVVAASPTATLPASPSASAKASGTVTPTRAPTPRPVVTRAPTPRPVVTLAPTLPPTPVPTPVPTPTDTPPLAQPVIQCSASTARAPYTLNCYIVNDSSYSGSDTFSWFVDGTQEGGARKISVHSTDAGFSHVELDVTRGGQTLSATAGAPWTIAP